MRGIYWFIILLIVQAVGLVASVIASGILSVTSLALMTAIAVCVVMYINVMGPITAMRNGMDLLRAQDYASRLRKVGHKDVDVAVTVFNDMMDRLKNEHTRFEERNLFLQQLIDASTQGILIADFDGNPVAANTAARAMLAEIHLPKIEVGESEVVRSSSGIIYRVIHQAFMDHGFRRSFYIVEVMTDELRRAEREAYGRIIRFISHEVNNTIAGIGSVLQTLDAATDDEAIHEVIAASIERAGNLSEFISGYASLVKLPDPHLVPMGLADSVDGLRAFLRAMADDAGVNIMFDLPYNTKIEVDPVQWEQVLVNIVKNAIESIVQTARDDGRVVIATPAMRTLQISDNGGGISDEVSAEIFSPFFTTKPGGQGIGLMLVTEILRRHGCRYSLATDSATGLTSFTIIFP